MSIILGIALLAVAFYTGRHVTRNMASNGSAGRLSATRAGHAIRSGVQRGSSGAEAIWATARSEDWLKRREARRTARAGRPTAGERIGSAARKTGASYRRRMVERANRPKPARSWVSRLITPTLPGDGEVTQVCDFPGDELRGRRAARNAARQATPAAAPTAPPPPAAVPAPTSRPVPAGMPQRPPTSPNGRNQPPMSSTASGNAADLFSAMQQVVSQARAGGLQAKHRAIKTFAEAHDYMSQTMQQFAQEMSEPDQGYPASIWEPLSQVAAHDKAASSKASESDAAMTALASMQVGELAGSATRAPHHRELNSDSASH